MKLIDALILTLLIAVFEIPLAIKCRQAIKNFDFARQIAISFLMLITGIIVGGCYFLINIIFNRSVFL